MLATKYRRSLSRARVPPGVTLGHWCDRRNIALRLPDLLNRPHDRHWVAAAIGVAQALAWASSFYLPSVLSREIAPDLSLTPSWIFGALSIGLAISALLAARVGHYIDLHGGRRVLCASNLILAFGLVLFASARGVTSLFMSWLVLGIGMAAGLYEPAFSALTHLYGRDSRGPMTGVTLIAGFASTVGWPTSAYLSHLFGWRGACLGWAALNVCVALPLNAWALRASQAAVPSRRMEARTSTTSAYDYRMLLLGIMFMASGIVSTGVASNMPDLLRASGAGNTAAIAAASFMGPAQVVARILEYSARRWVDPLLSARVALSLHPLGAAVLAIFGAPAVGSFSVIHGAGNGILTIAKGTLPLALFGPQGYGARIGRLSAPARIGQAAAPFIVGVLIERVGLWTLAVSSALSALSVLALMHPAMSTRSRC